MQKPTKIGSSRRIDSFIPRMLSTSSTATSSSSVASLKWPIAAGSRLNSASTPLATDIAIVST